MPLLFFVAQRKRSGVPVAPMAPYAQLPARPFAPKLPPCSAAQPQPAAPRRSPDGELEFQGGSERFSAERDSVSHAAESFDGERKELTAAHAIGVFQKAAASLRSPRFSVPRKPDCGARIADGLRSRTCIRGRILAHARSLSRPPVKHADARKERACHRSKPLPNIRFCLSLLNPAR